MDQGIDQDRSGSSDCARLTAGGGAIPFEASRLGFDVVSNDLNPVAVFLQRATVEFPLRLGAKLAPAFKALADQFTASRELRLTEFFPQEPEPNCIPTNYIWARTITCPYCDGVIPLSPNWRLAPNGIGVSVRPDIRRRVCDFVIVPASKEHSEGTVSGGDARCPYPSRMTRWHAKREVVAGTFDRHDFAMKWSYAEMAPLVAGVGFDWAIKQTAKCIDELVGMIDCSGSGVSSQRNFLEEPAPSTPSPVSLTITCGPADSMPQVDDESVDAVVIDPPYYDNVMYAELSGFFYVWLKRTAGYVFPKLFTRQLPDTDAEAVANPAKFKGKKGAKALAGRDYRHKMASIFAECRRVLKPDGILTLMFTHKATGAWDALATGLMDAGFTITASWPINTEAEGSLHIKDKSAANSTIFLVCRPRPEVRSDDEVAYWEDVEPRVASAVRTRIGEFQKAGLRGVDLYLSCFGPALEEFARHWPLRRGQPRPVVRPRRGQESLLLDPVDPYAVTPEDALDAARREVKRWRMEQLLRVARQTELDKLTEWFVLAWDAFRAPEFPYDEGLRLARVVGVDLDAEIVGHLAEKKASNLVLWDSAKRGAKGVLGPADGSRGVIDALHQVAWRIRQGNLQAGRELVEREQLLQDPAFVAGLTAALEVLPISAAFGHIDLDAGPVAEAASDFEALENLRRLLFSDRVPEPQQLALLAEVEG